VAVPDGRTVYDPEVRDGFRTLKQRLGRATDAEDS
jgi:hypothetical protein